MIWAKMPEKVNFYLSFGVTLGPLVVQVPRLMPLWPQAKRVILFLWSFSKKGFKIFPFPSSP